MELPVLLTKKDIDILRLMVKEFRRRNGIEGSKNPPILTAPEVYLAKTPPEGINGRSEADPPEAGYAVCGLYKINYNHEIVPLELEGEAVTKTVHNISRSAVAGDTYIAIDRDKFGTWFVTVEDCGEDTGTGTGTA